MVQTTPEHSDLAARVAALTKRLEVLEARTAMNFPAAILGSGRLPKWHGDVEVRAFVEDNIFDCTLDLLLARARERFGAARAPSRSSLGRYRKRLQTIARSFL